MYQEAKDPFFRQTSPSSSPGKTTPSLDLAASRLVKNYLFLHFLKNLQSLEEFLIFFETFQSFRFLSF